MKQDSIEDKKMPFLHRYTMTLAQSPTFFNYLRINKTHYQNFFMKTPLAFFIFGCCLIFCPSETFGKGNPLFPPGLLDTLINPPVLDAVISGDLCQGGTATATLTGADVYTWADNGSTDNPRDFNLPPGTHQIDVTGTDTLTNCSTTLTVNLVITGIPTPIILPTDGVICQGNSITLTALVDNGNTYLWSTGAANAPTISVSPTVSTFYTLEETNNGCSGLFQVLVSVQNPLPAPEISCGESTPESVQFAWPEITNATGYNVIVLSGQAGVKVDTTFTVSNLTPGEAVTIQVTSMGTLCGGQSSSFTCSAQDCPLIEMMFTQVPDICFEDSPGLIPLEVTLSDPSVNGNGWWTGPGITNTLNGIFDPVTAGIGTHEIVYHFEASLCFFSDTLMINIFETPESNFILSRDTICLTDMVEVTFTGSLTAGSVFNWDFDTGSSNLPSDAGGPHQITWNTTGPHSVSLQLSDDHCTSPLTSRTVEVSPPLELPVISCGPSTTHSVSFTWNSVANATGYQILDLDGPPGILAGTTYSVTGLAPEQSISIEITALSDGICTNTVATATCQVEACPDVTVNVTGPEAICQNDLAGFEMGISGSNEDFEISYTLNSGNPIIATGNTIFALPATTLNETTTLTILTYTNINAPECSYTGNAGWTIIVNEPLSAGSVTDTAIFCINTPSTIVLKNFLTGFSPGGSWSETSSIPSLAGAFDPAAGSFNTAGQAPGTYIFAYHIDAPSPCPDETTEVAIILNPVPSANAGTDQEIACNDDQVTLDGSGSDSGNGIYYQWLPPAGVTLSNPTAEIIEVGHPGFYLLEVTNEFGCSATDEVWVSQNDNIPEAAWDVQPISCYHAGDGSISIQNITGGTPPYAFSFEDGIFSEQLSYSELGAGTYSFVVMDANACFSEYNIELEEPQELTVEITTFPDQTTAIEYGDTIQLKAVYASALPLDTIIWNPEMFWANDQAAIMVAPLVTTQYGVLIIDKNGCIAEDEFMLLVRKTRPVYIPNAFSPNHDGINDIFYIQGGSSVTGVGSFSVFDRWGNNVFNVQNTKPNDPGSGWNGSYKGEPLPPAVYTYYAEVQFNGEEVIIFQGDITLIR